MSEAVRLPHPGIVEPGAVEAAVLTEVFDAVRLKSCGGVDLGLSHVSSPVFLVAPPVANHVDLGARLPPARDELEKVMQKGSVCLYQHISLPFFDFSFPLPKNSSKRGPS